MSAAALKAAPTRITPGGWFLIAFMALVKLPGVAVCGAMIGLLAGLVIQAIFHRSQFTSASFAVDLGICTAVIVWRAASSEGWKGRKLLGLILTSALLVGVFSRAIGLWSPIPAIVLGSMTLFCIAWTLMSAVLLARFTIQFAQRSRGSDARQEVPAAEESS